MANESGARGCHQKTEMSLSQAKSYARAEKAKPNLGNNKRTTTVSVTPKVNKKQSK